DHSRESNPLLAANIKQVEDKIDDLNNRLEKRRNEIERERFCTIADIQHHRRGWVMPHPERAAPKFAAMVRDDEIERIAIQAVIAHEESRGWRISSVEAENRGFDLISRRPHPEDPETAIEVRFIEVKLREGPGSVRSLSPPMSLRQQSGSRRISGSTSCSTADLRRRFGSCKILPDSVGSRS